ncbi:MAG TPA: SIR2 family protein [Pyrinomonadaceae bacterium]|nr:SIR2 family protein [Pyrinomonadaceae bacterium]
MATDRDDWEIDRDTHVSQIANQLMRGRLSFLIGSGMSIPSGGISGKTLAFNLIWKSLYSQYHDPLDHVFTEELKNVADKFPLEAIAEGAMPNLSFRQRELEEFLAENVFDGKTPQLHDGHIALAALVTKLNIKTIFTTNWDDLLKQALGESGEIITEQKFRDLDHVLDSGKTAIIHLHGTFSDNPLIREEDLMDPERPLFQVLMGELLTKVFVFVGYSLSDPNIRALYYKSGNILSKRSEKLEKNTYIVAPPSNRVERRVSTEVWKERHAIYIPMGAEEFFQALYKETATHALDKLKRRLKARLNISSEDLQTKIEEIMSVFPEFEGPEQVLFYLDAITRGGRS